MITRTEASIEPLNWQIALREAITDPNELWALLELDPALLPGGLAAHKDFNLRVPRSFVARMRKGDLNDPLLRQILPLGIELDSVEGYRADPLEEHRFNPLPGLLHKYSGRVLLTFTGVCAVNCRYCFRRHFTYEENNPGSKGWERALEYIAKDPTIHEVILSGGDPLLATDNHLKRFIDKLAEIPHVTTLRFHTRLPIVLPERITPELCQTLTSTRLQVVIVIHSNHPQEIDAAVAKALARLRHAFITLLNQSVLLKGINDELETLIDLSKTLFQHGVLPYYLHVLDKVQGAAHFDNNIKLAQNLHQSLRASLPGYLVPQLVEEIPGARNKVPLY